MMSTIMETNILHWNCNSIRNKKVEFFDYLINNNIHIACLNETKLRDSIRISHNQFRFIRLSNPGEGTVKGGVAIVLHKSISFSLLPSFNTETVEALGVAVSLHNGQQLRVVAAYFTGTTTNHDYDAYRRDIRKLIIPNALVFGDLNSKHSYWGCQRENRAGRILFEEMMRSNFEVHYPPSPTYYPGGSRSPSTLDIVLSTTNIQFEPVQVAADLGSDHLPILLQVHESIQTQIYNEVQCFSRAHWIRFKQSLNRQIDINYFRLNGPFTTADIDARVEKITEIMNNAANSAVPRVKIHAQRTVLNGEIRTLISQRRAARRELDRTGHPLVRQMYRNVNTKIQQLCNDQYNTRFQDFIKTFKPNHNNNQKLWSLSKTLKGKRALLPFLKVSNKLLITDNERAEALADAFQSNHEVTLNDRIPNNVQQSVERTVRLLERDERNDFDPSSFITPKELKDIIRKLPNKKSPGADGIRSEMLKNCSRKTIVALVYIFNACVVLSYFPEAWKKAIVIPVRKPGKPGCNVSSYRPISLLSLLGKIYERFLLRKIQIHTERTNVIPNTQFGFRSGHSTSHQVLRMVKKIKAGFRQTKSTGLILFDLKCAFDTVWHGGLLYKMDQIGLPRHIIKTIKSFLSNRTFSVKVGGCKSSERCIKAGVPQGAVLSPSLFNIYMYDMPTFEDCSTAQFADDVGIAHTNKRAASIKAKLEKAAKKFSKYVAQWRLKLNPLKTEAVFFTRRRAARAFPRRTIKLQNHELTWQQSAKYLGVTLDQKLTFKRHIENSIEKSGKVVKILYSLLSRKSKLEAVNKVLLYKTSIRPIMLYASTAWNNCAETHIRRIQVFQNRILKMCHNLPHYHPTHDLHQLTGTELIRDFMTRIHENFMMRCHFSDNPLINDLTSEIPVSHH